MAHYKAIERRSRIEEVREILLKIKKELNKEQLDEFVMQICVKYDVDMRRAKEYIKIAKYQIKHAK